MGMTKVILMAITTVGMDMVIMMTRLAWAKQVSGKEYLEKALNTIDKVKSHYNDKNLTI